jgi:hypothetical protein
LVAKEGTMSFRVGLLWLCVVVGCAVQGPEPTIDEAVAAPTDEAVSRREEAGFGGRLEAACPAGQKRCGLGACGNFCCTGAPPPNGQGGLPCDVPCRRDPETGINMCRP